MPAGKKPRSAGSRSGKIKAYYEFRYPEKKLRRMFHNGKSISEMKEWAAEYKAPSGSSAYASLVKLGKEFKLNLNQQ